MKRPMPWGRILLGIFTVVFLILAINLFVTSRKIHNKLEQARTAEPLRIDANLSVPGTYTGKLIQTYFWGQIVYIKPAQAFKSQHDTTAALAGLSGSVEIADSNGLIVINKEFNADTMVVRGYGISPELCYLREFPEGEYTVHFKILNGASALTTVPYLVYSCYNFCGMETLPVGLCFVYAMGFLLISIILVSIILIVTLFKRRKAKLIQGV